MIRTLLVAACAALALPATLLAQQTEATRQTGTYRLSLGDAARLATERSTPVLEARARTEGAQARVRGSLSDLLPRVDASAARSARTFNTASFGLDFPTIPGQPPFFDPDGEVVGPVDATDVRARAVVPLFDLSAFRRRSSAIAGADAAMAEEGAVEDAAATSAATAYIAVLRARSDVDAREEDLALAQELLEVAQGQLDAGVGVGIDVTRAQSQVATIRAQLLAAQHRAETAELMLRRTLHLPDAATLQLTDDLGTMAVEPLPVERQAIADALDQRSDLNAAEAYESAAEQSVSATRAGRLPRLTASVDQGFYGETYRNMLHTYSWSISLSVPVFHGLDRSSRIREQEARVRELGYRIEDMEEEVAFQVRQALLALGAAQEQEAAAAERLRLAELEVDQEEERLRAGVVGTADVVRAAMRLNAARTAHLDALAAAQTSRVRLAAARGAVTRLP
ncbi:MAG: TolC family protein [Gemmatimonadota bacterium]